MKTRAEKIVNDEHKICEYGCGKEAKYKFSNGKVCCSDYFGRCPKRRNDMSKNNPLNDPKVREKQRISNGTQNVERKKENIQLNIIQ